MGYALGRIREALRKMDRRVLCAILVAGFFILLNSSIEEYQRARYRIYLQRTPPMRISSEAFTEHGAIPARYTCDGENENPILVLEGVPDGTQSLALVMDDPDAPGGTFTHWTVWNIDPKTTLLDGERLPTGAKEGMTSFGKPGYGGPCPPPGKPHRYIFTLYALDVRLELDAGADLGVLRKAVEGHVLQTAELEGVYGR